jgi:hypothetical protein
MPQPNDLSRSLVALDQRSPNACALLGCDRPPASVGMA